MNKKTRTSSIHELATTINERFLIKLDINEAKTAFDFTTQKLSDIDTTVILQVLLRESHGNKEKVIDWSLIPMSIKDRRDIIVKFMREADVFVEPERLFHGMPITTDERRKFEMFLTKSFIKERRGNISLVDFSLVHYLSVDDIVKVLSSSTLGDLEKTQWHTLGLTPEALCEVFIRLGWVSSQVLRKMGVSDELLKHCQSEVINRGKYEVYELARNIDWSIMVYNQTTEKQIRDVVIVHGLPIEDIPMETILLFSIETLKDILLHIGKNATRQCLEKLKCWRDLIKNLASDAERKKCLMVAALVFNRMPIMNAYFRNILNWDMVIPTIETQVSALQYGYKSPEQFMEIDLERLYGSKENACKLWALELVRNYKVISLFPTFSSLIEPEQFTEILRFISKSFEKCIHYITKIKMDNENYFRVMKAILSVNLSYMNLLSWNQLSEDQVYHFATQCCKTSSTIKFLVHAFNRLDNNIDLFPLLEHIQKIDDFVELCRIVSDLNYNVAKQLLQFIEQKKEWKLLHRINILFLLNLSVEDREKLLFEHLRDYKSKYPDNAVQYGTTSLSYRKGHITPRAFLEMHEYMGSLSNIMSSFMREEGHLKIVKLYAIKARASNILKYEEDEFTLDEILEFNYHALFYYKHGSKLVADNQQLILDIIKTNHLKGDLELSTTCVVCFDDLGVDGKPYLYTKCMHSYCVDCGHDWMTRKSICAICRQPIC